MPKNEEVEEYPLPDYEKLGQRAEALMQSGKIKEVKVAGPTKADIKDARSSMEKEEIQHKLMIMSDLKKDS